MSDFPLSQWFDLERPISVADVEVCKAQMALYALKDGLEPDGAEWHGAVAELRRSVRAHNAKLGFRFNNRGVAR
jgi:hypothetical protein